MRCLLVSDLHYALKQFDWTVAAAKHFDVVVLAGDHVDIAGHVDGRAQVIVILRYLQHIHRSNAQLIVSSGNHDLDARNAEGEKTARWMARVRDLGVPTDGDSLEIDGTLFTICPWWDGPIVRAQVADLLARDAMRPKQRWIWVYHAPPDQSPVSWYNGRFEGDADLTQWVHQYAPDVVLSGHIHESPFLKQGSWADRIGSTWVFNAGRQIGPVPAHIVLDFDAEAAAWFSLAGIQEVRLDAPLSRPIADLDQWPDWLDLREPRVSAHA